MIKKFIVVLVALVYLFLNQSQVWAAAQSEEKLEGIILIDKSTFFAKEISPDLISKGIFTNETNSGLWVASIFITGLGQMLMGDIWRGAGFLINELLIFVVPYAVASALFGHSFYETFAFSLYAFPQLVAVLLLCMGIVYIWNIIDAYIMSQENLTLNKYDDNKLRKMEEQLNVKIEFIKGIKISDNGGVSLRAFTF
jgi:hypothetical protein